MKDVEVKILNMSDDKVFFETLGSKDLAKLVLGSSDDLIEDSIDLNIKLAEDIARRDGITVERAIIRRIMIDLATLERLSIPDEIPDEFLERLRKNKYTNLEINGSVYKLERFRVEIPKGVPIDQFAYQFDSEYDMLTAIPMINAMTHYKGQYYIDVDEQKVIFFYEKIK